MCADLAGLNHCAVPFLSRAAVNLCWYYSSVVFNYNDTFKLFVQFFCVHIPTLLPVKGNPQKLSQQEHNFYFPINEKI